MSQTGLPALERLRTSRAAARGRREVALSMLFPIQLTHFRVAGLSVERTGDRPTTYHYAGKADPLYPFRKLKVLEPLDTVNNCRVKLKE